jgi:hypothetical protein
VFFYSLKFPLIPLAQFSDDNSVEEYFMANVRTCLEEAMKLDGATGAVLIDLRSGKMLGLAGDSPCLDIEAAAHADMVKAQFRVMASLGGHETIEDLVITMGTKYHVMRCIGGAGGLMLFLTLVRRQANLDSARARLGQIEAELVV